MEALQGVAGEPELTVQIELYMHAMVAQEYQAMYSVACSGRRAASRLSRLGVFCIRRRRRRWCR